MAEGKKEKANKNGPTKGLIETQAVGQRTKNGSPSYSKTPTENVIKGKK